MKTKYIANTGEDISVYEEMDRFFRDIVERIGDRTDGPSEFEIKSEIIYSKAKDGTLIPKDDKIHYLLYREQPVASVLEVRDDKNYIRFTFFENLEDLEVLVDS